MDEYTLRRRCPSCGTGGDYPATIKSCPLCGGSLEAELATADDSLVELLIPFAATQCPSCGMTTFLRRNQKCPGCGSDLSDETRPRVGEAVRRRRDAFKIRIQRLTRHAQDSAILQPSFTRKGQEVSLTDYTDTVFESTRNEATALTEDVRMQLRAVTWDPQEDPRCIASFQQIVSALDKGIALVTTLASLLPPIQVRAAHRILTRAIGQMIHGYITIMEALIAMDLDEMLERRQKGQELFMLGARTLEPLQLIIKRASKETSPGWWMSGDTLDLAAVAWEGVENTPTTIAQAADIVRAALATIPGVTEMGDAEALLLLPATVLPVTIADPVLLQERAGLIRDVLTRADSAAPNWIQGPDELVLRINEGIGAMIEQVERLGFAATSPYSRRMTIQLLAEVYLKLVEGPLRDFGSVVVIAARAAGGEPNGGYTRKIARGVQAGDIVQELERMGPLWRDAVQMLFRNAGAHAGVSVLDTGVAMTQRKTEDGVLVDEQTEVMNDAEFAEEFARLNEVCLALQLGILPWLFTHQSEHVARALQAASPTQRECERLVRLLAGLQGLQQVIVKRDGNALIVRAETANSVDASSPLILSLVPAIFHSWADIDSVTLNIGPRNPVTYERAELPGVDPLSGQQDLVAIGLMGRRWLGDLSGDAAIAADITYLVQPQLIAIGEAFGYAATSPLSAARIAEAHARMVDLKNRLRRAQLPLPSTPLVAEVREAMHDAVRRLDRLRWAFVGSDVRERERQTRSFVAFNDRLRDIARRSDAEFARVKGDEKGK
jgi:hypothetical protein